MAIYNPGFLRNLRSTCPKDMYFFVLQESVLITRKAQARSPNLSYEREICRRQSQQELIISYH